MSHPKPSATPLEMELWPGPVPKDIGIEGQEKTHIHNSRFEGVGQTLLLTNVTRPAIKVYLPSPETNTGTAMIICPGGGYWDLFWDLEGEEVAAWLLSQGMAAIILKYRVPRRPGEEKKVPAPGPLLDAQRAVSTVRSHATEWRINPDRIGMVGFSAGGHLCLATATSFHERGYPQIDNTDTISCRPNFAVLCYSGYLKHKDRDEIADGLHIPSDTPPIFLTHASDDTESDVAHSAIMYLALQRAKIPAELHIYASGEHDFGVRQNGNLPASWPNLCLNWLRSNNLLPEPLG
ncbi:MAG: alpha/beta hydrolase [bacterium]|nr:alpha/beta hydrolase [bacterium]